METAAVLVTLVEFLETLKFMSHIAKNEDIPKRTSVHS
jgi:hypothetical protein